MIYSTSRGEQRLTVDGNSYAKAHAGLRYINASSGSNSHSGQGGAPGSYATVISTSDPASSLFPHHCQVSFSSP